MLNYREVAKILHKAIHVRKAYLKNRSFSKVRIAWLRLACNRLANNGYTETARALADGIFFGEY